MTEGRKQRLNTAIDLTTQPNKIGGIVDSHGFNIDTNKRLSPVLKKIEQLKKSGAPELPEKPSHPGRKAPESQLTKYREQRSSYDDKLAEFNRFQSEKFVQTKIVSEMVVTLQKLVTLLQKQNRTESVQKEIEKLLGNTKKDVTRRVHETEESYDNKLTIQKKLIKSLGDRDFSKPEICTKTVTALLKKYPEAELFLEKRALAQDLIRPSPTSRVAIATITEEMIKDILSHSLKVTTEKKKKTMKPDACAEPGFEKMKTYALFKSLPHFESLQAKAVRRREWELLKKISDAEDSMRAKQRAAKLKEKRVKIQSNFPSFEDWEVENNHAVKFEISVPVQGKDNEFKTKMVYEWTGIDSSEDSLENEFVRTTEKIHKSIKGENDVKLSTPLKKFISNLIGDFLQRFSGVIREQSASKGIVKIKSELILVALRVYLLSHTDDSSMKQYEKLFDAVESKVRAATNHITSTKTAAKSNESTEIIDKLDEDEDEL